MTTKHFDGVIAGQRLFERIGKQPPAHIVAKDRHRMKVRVDGTAAKRFERRFGAKVSWGPIGLRIHVSQKSEHRTPQRKRHGPTQPFLGKMKAVPAIAPKILITAVA